MSTSDAADITVWAAELSESYLSAALPRRWAHVRSVAAEARRIADSVAPDGELLVAAALLHDVGYAPDLVRAGFHPLDGAEHLVAMGADARLCALVARHSCAIREAHMRGFGEAAEAFEDERTPLRDALWYCDMVTGPDGSRVRFEDRVAEIQHRYGPADPVSRFIRAAHADLASAVARTVALMRERGLGEPTYV